MYHLKWFDVRWHDHEYNKEQEIATPQQRTYFFFYRYWKQQHIYVHGFTSRLLLVSRCSMWIFPYYNKQYEKLLDWHIKIDTSSCDMNEKVEHWLDTFEKFHKKYIIIPFEWLNYYFFKGSLYIIVKSPPGFINQENDRRFDLNATIQLLYCNILFIQLILNIDCYTMMIGLDERN